MSSLKDLASLIMIPSLVKDGRLDTVKPLGNGIIHPDATGNNDGTDGSTPSEGNFTFSRGSNLAATRVDVNGLIEKGRENLLLQSNQFDTTWNLDGSTITGGQTGYDGSNNAWLFSKTSPFDGLNQAGLSQSGISTTSIYAKIPSSENDVNALLFRIQDSSGDSVVTFNLTNDTIPNLAGNAVAADKVNVGNGWYRCSLSVNATISRVNFRPAIGTSTGASTGTLLFQDSQLEQGLVATDYIETGASTAQAGILEDLPRLDYSGGASCPALLLEPSRTNLVTQSEYFGGSYWNPLQTIVTENEAISPEGLQNSAKLSAVTGQANHQLDASNISISSGAVTGSVFAKKGANIDWLRLRLSGTSNPPRAWFDLENGVVGDVDTSGTASIEDYGNGWYRCSLTEAGNTASSAIGRLQIFLNESNGQTQFNPDGDEYHYIYGAQLEAGNFSTSLIPTYGSAVTRSVDQLETSPYDYQSQGVLGANVGTIILDCETIGTSTGSNDFHMFGAVSSIADGYLLRANSGSTWDILERNGNSTSAQYTSIAQKQTRNKIGISYSGADVDVYVNGIVKSVSSGTPVGGGNINGFSNSASNKAGLIIHQILLFPNKLTDSEMASITTI